MKPTHLLVYVISTMVLSCTKGGAKGSPPAVPTLPTAEKPGDVKPRGSTDEAVDNGSAQPAARQKTDSDRVEAVKSSPNVLVGTWLSACMQYEQGSFMSSQQFRADGTYTAEVATFSDGQCTASRRSFHSVEGSADIGAASAVVDGAYQMNLLNVISIMDNQRLSVGSVYTLFSVANNVLQVGEADGAATGRSPEARARTLSSVKYLKKP